MKPNRNVTIALTVSTKYLYANPNANPDAYCVLSDDHKGKYVGGIKPEFFESDVYSDNMVIWSGYSVESDYSVEILDYVPKISNDSVIDTATKKILGKNGYERGYQVIADADAAGKTDDYEIKFKIHKTGSASKEFTIDPKLKGNP